MEKTSVFMELKNAYTDPSKYVKIVPETTEAFLCQEKNLEKIVIGSPRLKTKTTIKMLQIK